MKSVALGAAYLSALPTSANSLDSFVPRADRAPMRKTAISEAISAYSIAVAPDSLATKDLRDLIITLLLLQKLPSGALTSPLGIRPI